MDETSNNFEFSSGYMRRKKAKRNELFNLIIFAISISTIIIFIVAAIVRLGISK